MCCFSASFKLNLLKNQSCVLILTVYKTVALCVFLQASENTTTKQNPGKADIYGVLCKSFLIFPGMFPYYFLICYIPYKEVIFYSASHVPLHTLIGHLHSG